MAYRDRIKSHDQLKALCELLEWANASDADENDRCPNFASQRGVYGHIWNAIHEIVWEEAGICRDSLGDVNWGGNESWYDDLMSSVDNARYTQEYLCCKFV